MKHLPPRIFTFVLISFLFLLFGCKKNNIETAPEDSLISWLNKNGGPYKEGNIQVKHSNGSISTGKLDWNKIKSFTSHNRQYWSIPFLFNNNKLIHPSENTSESVTLNMVIRVDKNGKYEGALKTSIYNTSLKDINGNISKKNTESYQLIDGSESTLWVSNQDFTNKRKVNRLPNEKEFENSSLNAAAYGQNCQDFHFTNYNVECYAGNDYATTCYFSSYTTYFTICGNEEESDDGEGNYGDDWDDSDGNGGGENCECVNEFESSLAGILAGINTASETISMEMVPINDHKKYKNPKWRCLTGIGWELNSKETGIVQLVDVQKNKWVWISLKHNSITLNGSVIGVVIEPDSGTGTPSFVEGNSNVLRAGMELDFNVKFSAICDCWGLTPHYTQNYKSTSTFWYATP